MQYKLTTKDNLKSLYLLCGFIGILFGIEKSQDLEINIACTEIIKSNITNLRHSALY